RDLLGDDRGVKILDLTKSSSLMEPANALPESPGRIGCTVQAVQPVKIALEMMMKNNADQVGVCDGETVVGILTWNGIKEHINRVSGDEL
ncbi:MAG: ABC transporter ATP-binding protein, partial [Thermodesulfobacteriota bacterium]